MNELAHRIAFGERLRDLRQERGWTSQEAFALYVGLDRTDFSGIWRGRLNPTLNIIVKFAHGLQIRPTELPAMIDLRSALLIH